MAHKRPVGRPSTYREEYNDKATEYLALCVDEETEFHKTRGEKSDSYDRILNVKLPTIVGFGRYIGILERTLYDWADEHPEFLQSLERIKEEQRIRLLAKGLSGEYNPIIAKLILSSDHGMSDKQVVTGGKDKSGNDIPLQNVIVIKQFKDATDSK